MDVEFEEAEKEKKQKRVASEEISVLAFNLVYIILNVNRYSILPDQLTLHQDHGSAMTMCLVRASLKLKSISLTTLAALKAKGMLRNSVKITSTGITSDIAMAAWPGSSVAINPIAKNDDAFSELEVCDRVNFPTLHAAGYRK